MEKGIKSKRRILEIAYKLFSAYSYPDVSYSLLEEATGISRGSMVYYFKNKEGIFRAVVQEFLLDSDTVKFEESDLTSVKNLCRKVETLAQARRDAAKEYRIPNPDEANFNLARNAMQFIPEYKEHRREVQAREYILWKRALDASRKSGEVRDDIDVELMASIFQSVNAGQKALGTVVPGGSDPEYLRRLYENLIESISPR